MATQLWFDFTPSDICHDLANFCNGRSNADARSALNRWRSWASGAVLLVGPRGCGKSHLANIWLQTNGGQKISAAAIPQRLDGNLVLENADQELDEEGLFHLMNRANSGQAKLLITARTGPRGWTLQLGDLRSRLHATELVRIDQPDDDVLSCILLKLCKDRSLRPNQRLIQYLMERMERSSEGALRLVEALNAKSLETSRPVNMKLARETLLQLDEVPELLTLMQTDGAKFSGQKT
ncbi:hypothetical protein MNBD_ALPHA06-304 [hydrothermal vent metagenome]|uniref:Chromosomal replication initiator protein DnaA n=1 Tax=hydrothermal vent metagenome TaxID=652676 RepID=A0A3B0RZX4_9ZZZZ